MLVNLRELLRGGRGSYEPLPPDSPPALKFMTSPSAQRRAAIFVIIFGTAAAVYILAIGTSASSRHGDSACDSVQQGFQCRPQISHFWGQYSPFFSVDSTIPGEVPPSCSITFANVLSRHGARDPTAHKTESYRATVQKIKANVKSYSGKYAFLKEYKYTLGADQLTPFGQQEMVNSGIKFYNRYKELASRLTPFVRSGSQNRVVQSAQNFTQGYHVAKLADTRSEHHDSSYPYNILEISEAYGQNNSLSHGLCERFEDGTENTIAPDAQEKWASTFVPAIRNRLNSALRGANLSTTEVIYIMDLCPFDTMASPNGAISPFCGLFSEEEWHYYNYYETLNKYYGFSYGNPLGSTQGIGFANELIARLTSSNVDDETSTNHTLDDNPATFPLHRSLYADFSHDNDMTSIFSALGLYNGTGPLSNTTMTEAQDSNGYSAAWTVPFAARAYFEKMRCLGAPEEYVRVIVNDRVLPLKQCDGDALGRCTLNQFVSSLEFARSGGNWDLCTSNEVIRT